MWRIRETAFSALFVWAVGTVWPWQAAAHLGHNAGDLALASERLSPADRHARLLRLASAAKSNGNTQSDEVDSEDIFGFTSGTDLPELGQKQGEIGFDARWGKRDGSYTALTKEIALKYMALPDTRFAVSGAFARHRISGVTGLDDRDQFAFQGLGFEIKHRFLDRSKAPFGIALSVAPGWARIDETNGARVREYGVGFTLAVDREIVPDRFFGAVNLLYDLASSRDHVTRLGERESSLGISAAGTVQVSPGVFLGGEARYMRAYDGLALGAFAGEAVFLGPTFMAKLGKCCFVAAAWSTQVWGKESGGMGSLDLVNFERHQATVKFGFDF